MLLQQIQDPRVLTLQKALEEQKTLVIEGLWDSPKALIASWAQKITGKQVLIVTGASREESRTYHDLRYLCDSPVLDFPAWETLPSEKVPPSPDIVGERYRILGQVHAATTPHIVLTSLQGLLQRVIPPQAFDDLFFILKKSNTVPYEQLIDRLIKMGYRRCTVAADKGEFAVRGGLIDVFPVSRPEPVRIEFWGDEIESIRLFDPVGQQSVGSVEEVELTPAREMELLSECEQLGSLLDYLGPDTLIIMDDLLALEDRYVSLLNIPGTLSDSFSSMEQLFQEIEPLQKMYWTNHSLEEMGEVHYEKGGNSYSATADVNPLTFQMFGRSLKANRWNHPFVSAIDYLNPPASDGQVIQGELLLEAISSCPKETELQFLCSTDSDESHLKDRLKALDVTLPEKTSFHRGYLSSGIALPEVPLLVIPLTEITGQHKIRRQKMRSTYHTVPSQMFELLPGDNVVHTGHGVGRYLGIEKQPNHEGIETEFFLLEYAKDAKLYVPMTQSHLVTKYVGSGESSAVALNALGSKKWKKTRTTTEKAIMGYAADLLDLYAKRSLKGGEQYPEDSLDVLRFAEDFPYVESEDQKQAITAIHDDMVAPNCMDRLVCGDVGYGKTEVAMRAAFKTVLDAGKQVAILVPTTVLALQHYETFRERMRNYPVTIRALSRFSSTKETRQTLEAISSGGVDIVIGTHRIVSKDVCFKNLGLVGIDEEQRFGVRAKEHLKKIRTGVDCLTLSATPIPRTLYLSLMGARDLSVIATPPQDRLPIKTVIAEGSDQLLKSALLRELSRDGQAFVIHNRVDSIDHYAARIKKLLPQARVVVGHGQMTPVQLDTVFHLFKSGEADILVATTIVENGIDIPNANTILIDRADRFGLAELYQLRGRVGRWNRQAYAYFLVPQKRVLSELAYKRLQALAEASGYGGGMKLAMRDLELRGAGDILGTEQSGQVAAVGFHLYCKLLKRTIEALKGEMPSTLVDTKVEFPFDARLPEEYVNASSLRMEFYQRFGEAITFDEVDGVWRELKDRFGPAPEPARWLYHLTRIRVFASRYSFVLLKLNRMTLTIERQKGKEVETKQVLFKKPKTAADMEASVIKALKKGFQL